MAVLLGLLYGLLRGLQHAFDPDHVVAMSTMIGEQRSARARIGYAVAWGFGHAAMLVLVGVLLIVLRTELPLRLDAAFELAVAVMLIGLGARALAGALREGRRRQAHGHEHSPAASGPVGWRRIGPFAMGVVHGLAGSGALTALVVARLPSPVVGVLFMVLFGAGATLGMSLLAGAAGVPLARLLRARWGMPLLLGATGGLSLLLGLLWIGPAAVRLVG